MTGLDPAHDVILEIATLITTSDLTLVDPGLSLVIHQSDEQLARMNDWCKNQHKKSGLTADVQASTISLQQAEEQTHAYITRWCTPQSAPLCGNTVFQDRAFLRAYMPRVDAALHYRIIDVSSLKELVKKWYPNNPNALFHKNEHHRALGDITASIAELRHYRNHFFR